MSDATNTQPNPPNACGLSPRCVLLDRDGVINVDSASYVKTPDEWQPLPGSIEAIADLQVAGFTVAVCTNQSGIARGYFSMDTLHQIHAKLNKALSDIGGTPLPVYFCPHGPDAQCDCRKPKPGLLETAMADHDVAPHQTVYIGDSAKDVIAAAAARCTAILVLTGNGHTAQDELSGQVATPPATHEDLAAAARSLIRRRG